MKPIPKWLAIPPAVALLLILGPMTMQGAGSTSSGSPALRAGVPATAAPDESRPRAKKSRNRSSLAKPADTVPALPPTPGFWQISSTLIGVLLLGGLGLYGLRRLRGGAVPTRGTKLVTLRQTLRLTQRQALHAIEFNDRILLIGETERGLALIESSVAPEQASDEAEAVARAAAILDAAIVDDDGAVPKNLLIPRPDNPQHQLPQQPVMPKPAARAPSLSDFRSLLQKAGRA